MMEDLDLLMTLSDASAQASLLLSILGIQGEDRETARKKLAAVPSATLNAVIGEVSSASPYCRLMVTRAILGRQGTNHPFEDFLLYAAALAPSSEAFDTRTGNDDMDLLHIVGSVAVTIEQRLQKGFTAEFSDVETKMALARGVLITVYTSNLLGDYSVPDSKLMWLGSNYQRINTIAGELRSRRSSDPILIQRLLNESIPALCEGLL